MTKRLDHTSDPLPQPLRRYLDGPVPRATGYLVTIYGDAVAPRGGTVSMRSLIALGRQAGLSETLVRTAVSRLVGAERLEGTRVGRVSHYRLTPGAEAEFAGADRLIYAPPPQPLGWLMAFGERDLPAPWARIGGTVWAAPDRAEVERPAGLVMSAAPVSQGQGLREFGAAHWSLGEADAAYRAFAEAWSGVTEALAEAPAEGQGALLLRLRLVHDYRQAALADPRLPEGALPEGWQGAAARRLFVSAYLALCPEADRCIGARLEDRHGLLPPETEATRARLGGLRREAVLP